MYKLFYHPQLKNLNSIYRQLDGAFIPIDERNLDYQEYLKWVAEGNIAEEWIPEEV